jgi:hypothetical protein
MPRARYLLPAIYFILHILFSPAFALERDYQTTWCAAAGGAVEYTLPDRSRVDCLTATHAIEIDYARKWQEAVGQALYYAVVTNRRPGIVLILENTQDRRYADRLRTVADRYGITVWTIGHEP